MDGLLLKITDFEVEMADDVNERLLPNVTELENVFAMGWVSNDEVHNTAWVSPKDRAS